MRYVVAAGRRPLANQLSGRPAWRRSIEASAHRVARASFFDAAGRAISAITELFGWQQWNLINWLAVVVVLLVAAIGPNEWT